MYFKCLDLYFECLGLYLGVWICIWVSGVVFGCLDLYFGCLDLYFECMDVYPGCLHLYLGPNGPIKAQWAQAQGKAIFSLKSRIKWDGDGETRCASTWWTNMVNQAKSTCRRQNGVQSHMQSAFHGGK